MSDFTRDEFDIDLDWLECEGLTQIIRDIFNDDPPYLALSFEDRMVLSLCLPLGAKDNGVWYKMPLIDVLREWLEDYRPGLEGSGYAIDDPEALALIASLRAMVDELERGLAGRPLPPQTSGDATAPPAVPGR